MKTRARKKTAAKTALKKTKKAMGKKSTRDGVDANSAKEPRSVQVRKVITRMVEAAAPKIAKGLIGEAQKGQVPQAKYLYEFASIFPVPEGESGTTQDSVAKSLMRALGIPEEPITYDAEGNVVTAVVVAPMVVTPVVPLAIKDLAGRGGMAEKNFGGEDAAEEHRPRAVVAGPGDPVLQGERAGVPAPHRATQQQAAPLGSDPVE